MKKIKTNIIYNEDCFITMKRLKQKKTYPNIILTSPPYNTSKTSGKRNDHQNRYDIHLDNMTQDEYVKWTTNLFNKYDGILETNGVILYNLSYASGKINENISQQMYLLVADIIKNTNFMVADTIGWKKSNAIPDNMTPNKATRIMEFIYVFCRKDEYHTFKSNKNIVNIMPHNGVKVYDTFTNFIEAKNNDYKSKLNKATFSSDLVIELLKRYAFENAIVYDSFIGTGTTAIGVIKYGESVKYIGSELSKNQIEEFYIRLNKIK